MRNSNNARPPQDAFPITEQARVVPGYAAVVDLDASVRGYVTTIGELEGRLAKQQERARSDTAELFDDLLDVADALDRIEAMACEKPAQAAVRATGKLLRRVLSARGVVRVSLVGRPADPDVVDIDGTELDPSLPAETVVREVRAAYMWGDTVLRRGVVVVSQPGGSQPGGSQPGGSSRGEP